MNYCDKIQYTIHKTEGGLFEQQVEALLDKLPEAGEVLRIIVFGAPENNLQYVEQRDFLHCSVSRKFGDKMPVLNYVAQPPLEGGLVMEVHRYLPDNGEKLAYRMYGNCSYVLLENEEGRFLFSGGWQSDLSANIYVQSQDVFERIRGLLEKEGFAVDSIVRQWNYIERITAKDGEDQHYQMFNNARSEFYAEAQWKDGYPAATGIGSTCGGVLVDLDAAVFSQETCFCTPIDNRLQVAAHAYSDDVLIPAGSRKTTPKFERAKSLTFDGRRLVYISGTAAIRGEESLIGVGIERQWEITMENIAQLIGEAKIGLLRVYLKYAEDYAAVKRCLSDHEKNMAISYLETDVCRDELLIEIEGIAVE